MPTLTCEHCRTTLSVSDDESGSLAALAWMSAHEGGRDVHYCPTCARENLRAIEGKLDPVFW
jgi:hypothetical protein